MGWPSTPPAPPPAALESFDPSRFVELPGSGGRWVARHAPPCGDCGGRAWDLVEVTPPSGHKPAWAGVCCRACVAAGRLVSIGHRDAVATIGTLDPGSGGLVIFPKGGDS